MASSWHITVRVGGEKHYILRDEAPKSGTMMWWDGKEYVVNAISIKPHRQEAIIHLIPKEIDFFFTK